MTSIITGVEGRPHWESGLFERLGGGKRASLGSTVGWKNRKSTIPEAKCAWSVWGAARKPVWLKLSQGGRERAVCSRCRQKRNRATSHGDLQAIVNETGATGEFHTEQWHDPAQVFTGLVRLSCWNKPMGTKASARWSVRDLWNRPGEPGQSSEKG